jgi:Phage ABA sandwich domain
MDSTVSALDTLVAEHVMALVPCDAWEPINLGSAGGPALLKRCSAPHHCYPRHHPMAFSSRIAAAWHIVDHLADQGWETRISRVPGRDSAYEVQIDKHTGDPADTVTAVAPTAPLALCIASLRASGYQGPIP